MATTHQLPAVTELGPFPARPSPVNDTFPIKTHFLSTPEYDMHFLILSPEKTCLYIRIKSLARCNTGPLGRKLLENALQLVEAFADASKRDNAIKMVFDVRRTEGISWRLLLPLVEWMIENKPLFKRKLCESHILLESEIWRQLLKQAIRMAGTVRPVFFNNCPFLHHLPCN